MSGRGRRGRSAKSGSKGDQGAAAAPFMFSYTEAIVLFNTEKYDECVALCRKGVGDGDGGAQALLGGCYVDGIGVDKGEAEGVRLAQLSAAQGDPAGQHMLGWCHQQGYGGLPKDAAKATELYRLSAAQGWAPGQRDHAYMLYEGDGVEEDQAEARRLNRMACAQGDAVALGNEAFESDATLPEKLRLYFRAATATARHATDDNRATYTDDCAATAHALTDPDGDDHDPADFVKGVQLCVDDAVAANEAKHRHTTQLAAALDDHRADHDPNAGDDGDTPHPTACDVTLEAQGGTGFPCHRLVLAAASGYFRTLFEGAFAESRAPTIQLKDCDAAMAGRLVAYVYSGKAEFASVEDAAAVMEQAQFYQVATLMQDCAAFLAPRVGASNSLLVDAVALGPLCTDLADVARTTTARDFDLASKTDMFLAGGLESLQVLLADDAVHAPREDTVLEAVLAWVGHDAAARQQHLCALLDGVRLADVSLECFAEALRSPLIQGELAAITKLSLGFTMKVAGGSGGGGGARAAKRARKT